MHQALAAALEKTRIEVDWRARQLTRISADLDKRSNYQVGCLQLKSLQAELAGHHGAGNLPVGIHKVCTDAHMHMCIQLRSDFLACMQMRAIEL